MPTASEKTQNKKNDKVIPVKSTEYEDAFSAVLQIAERIQSSLANVNAIALVQPFQASQAIEAFMSQQAEMMAKVAKMASNVTIAPSVFTHLSDLANSFAAVDIPRYAPVISQPTEDVDRKRYISLLQKELNVKERKIKQLLEALESFKKRSKDKTDYIR